MKDIYVVEYNGLWMGGIAVVRASSEEEALELVANDPETVDFTDATATKVDKNESVIYNNNGNY